MDDLLDQADAALKQAPDDDLLAQAGRAVQEPRMEQAREWARKKLSDAPVSVMGVPGWGINLGKEVGSETLGGVGISVKDVLQKAIPFTELQGKVDTNRYGEAVKAYQGGSATDTQLGQIAEYELDQERQAARSQRSKIAAAGLGVPKIVGEFAATGPIGRGVGAALGGGTAAGMAGTAAATGAMPEFWLEESQQRANKNGGDWFDPKNVAAPLAKAAVQNVILGQIGKFAGSEAVASTASTALGRLGARAAVGAAAMPIESAAAEALTGGVQDTLDSAGFGKYLDPKEDRYKTFRDALAGKWGDVGTKLATDSLLGAGFAAFHGKESKAVEEAQKQIEKLPEAPKPSEKPTPDQEQAGQAPESPQTAPEPPTAPEAAGREIGPQAKPQEAGPVSDAVRAAFGDRTEDLGQGMYSVTHGDRFLAISPDGEGRVSINFASNEHVPGRGTGAETTAKVPLGMRSGTKAISDDLRSVVRELGSRGIDISYTASPDKGEGGRSSRADVYERALIKAGYEKVQEGSGDKPFVWVPKEKAQLLRGDHPAQQEARDADTELLRRGINPRLVAEAGRRAQDAGYAPREVPPAETGRAAPSQAEGGRPADSQGPPASPPQAGPDPVPGTEGRTGEPAMRLSASPSTPKPADVFRSLGNEALGQVTDLATLRDKFDATVGKMKGDQIREILADLGFRSKGSNKDDVARLRRVLDEQFINRQRGDAILKEGGVTRETGQGAGEQAGVTRNAMPPGPTTREAVAAALKPDPSVGRGILRTNLAKEAHANAVGEDALKSGVDLYDTGIAKARGDENKLIDNFLHFVDPIETHKIADVEPGKPSVVRDLMWTVRRLNNEMEAELVKRGMLKDDSLIEDYLGHQWLDPKDPNATPQQIGERLSRARRPFEGSKGFQKERTLPTYADGFRAGLTPRDWNPVRSVLAKRAEVAKAIMAHDVASELEDRGLWEFVKLGDRPKPEWEQVNDKIASVFYRTKQGVGPVLAGHYYTPKEIAKDINNHLSPGLYGQNKLYDVTRGAANLLNQFQLGFSAFHAGFVTMDAQVSAAALGVKMLSRGDVGPGLKQLAIGLTPGVPAVRAYLAGTKIGREYFKPGSQGADVAATVAALDEAGGRARMDAFYGGTHFDAFRKAVEQVRYGSLGKVPTVFGRALPALSDVFSKPVMEKLVPRMKMGVFADMAKYELSKLPNPSIDQVRSVLGKSWDSVENRIGQMTYDNLFWNRTFKDSLMLGVRSVGWNLGTIRELGGGLKDAPKSAKGLVHGEGVTDRTAYVVALPMIAAAWGAIYGYLNGNPPKDWRDTINPRTGRKNPDGADERVNLPSYMRDVMSLTNRWEEGPVRIAQNAYEMAKHKLNPLIGLTAEMLENKDFTGTAIFDPKDSTTKQARDMALHVIAAFEPLAAKQARGAGGKKPTDQQRVEGFVGITPAPYSVTHTTAQQEAAEDKRKIQLSPLEKKRQADKKK